ncbi:MAG: class I SAM-dependent methyltransferase [Candidatus Saganbacteria bacterium]|nr:class I SAM-dependent methyltransferase [Candidatus Saganbacteria bacterium]
MVKDNAVIKKIYQKRFNALELKRRLALWKILCSDFLQKFVPLDSIVLDIGAGYCEFINNIKASSKFAVDLNPDSFDFANDKVKIIKDNSTQLSFFLDSSVDIVFMSNFLEHLSSKEDVLNTLRAVFRVLKPNGKIMILQPNIRYSFDEYWDFFDHNIPLSEKSVAEALSLVGYKIEKVIARFLPYKTKKKAVRFPYLLKLYLRIPVFWQLFGKQMFVVASKP